MDCGYCVFLGCGPVGQFAIASSFLRGVSKIIAVDTIPSRLIMAQIQGAEIIDFNKEDPIEKLKDLTDVKMINVVIDAVGVDAYCPEHALLIEDLLTKRIIFQKN